MKPPSQRRLKPQLRRSGLESARRLLQRGESDPVWFAFETPPRAEPRARAWLEYHDVEAWYPTEQAWRRVPRGPRRRVPYERAVVPRYVFARFTGTPQWHALQQCRWLSRVIAIDGRPLPVSESAMSEMAKVPPRLSAMRRREEEARIVRPGDEVELLDGPMQGWVVEVAEVHQGLARFLVPLLGSAMAEVPLQRVAKLGVDR